MWNWVKVKRYIAVFNEGRSIMGPQVTRLMTISAILGFGWSFLEGCFAIILQGFLVAIGLISHEQSMLPNWYPSSLNSCLIILGMAGAAKAFLIILKVHVRTSASNLFLYQQRRNFFHHAMGNAASESTQKISSFLSDTISKSSNFASSAANVLTSAITATVILGICFSVAPDLTYYALIICFLAMMPFQYLARKVGNYGQEAKKRGNHAWHMILQSFRNYFFLRLTGTTDAASREVDQELRGYYDVYQSYSLLTAVRTAIPHALGVLVVIIISYIEYNSNVFKPAVLLSFVYLFNRFAATLSDLNANTVTLRFMWPYFSQMLEKYRKTNADHESFVGKLRSEQMVHGPLVISLKDVWYRYPASESAVIRGISLDFREGEALLLKGESGVGKSTLVGILLGVLRPISGKVLLNGLEVPDVLSELSRLVGYVGPDPYLITGTVKDNLVYGLPAQEISQLTDEVLYSALAVARASDFVNTFPKKLNEYLHEHVQISTGQRQRLAIARALLRKPRMLVLDEATANLDKVTEKALIDDFAGLLKSGVGLLIVTHRDSFDEIATKKLLLERPDGNVIDVKAVH